MSLSPGSRVGPYEVLTKLGEGGMGQVYRARDTSLGRDVALKILPEAFAADSERLARFEREARTLASLNHPNIAAIYGIERQTNTRALVMELVAGEDLSRVLARGAVPASDAVAIATQIASALESAHDLGVVHRDLKPANVMLRDDGTVKILDFGLAKAVAPEDAAARGDAMNSPTLTAAYAPGTQLGMILGTAAYMAPEQARGKSVDKRADIWAFGVVVFEMLTGRRLFAGDDVSDVLAAVLRQDVDWTALPADTPPRVRAMLERCLDRDLKTRLRDIGEARVALTRADGPPSSGATQTAAPAIAASGARTASRFGARELTAWGLALAGVAAAIGVWLTRPGAQQTAGGSAHTAVLTFVPPDTLVSDATGTVISPDGQKLAFTGRAADGTRSLWIRRIDTLEVTQLPDTVDAIEPFWSPDSRSIAFGAQGKLKRLDLGATRASVLTDAARSNNGSWSPAGVIVFSPDYRQPLVRVSDTGSDRKPATTLDTKAGDTGHRYPWFLPDGRHFLFWASRDGTQALMAGSIDSPDTKVLLENAGAAIYAAPGWLIYIRNGVVVAHAFDADRLELSGNPEPIAGIATRGSTARGARLSASAAGTLVIQDSPDYEYSLMWYSRDGSTVEMIGPARRVNVQEFPRISPDGRHVVVQRVDPATQNQDLWLGDVARKTFDRLTTNPAQEQLAIWAPDGKSVFATTWRNGRNGVFRIPLDGSAEQLLVPGTVFPGHIAKDGKTFFYMQRGITTRSDLWSLPYVSTGLAASAAPVGARAILDTEADEMQGQVSPDGQWFAYMSDVSGIPEIYVRRFEADGRLSTAATRVTTGGGTQPCWAHSGRELYYVNVAKGFRDAQMMMVPVLPASASSQALEFGKATILFKMSMFPQSSVIRDYDVSPNDQQFLVGTTMGDARPSPATIVVNWKR